MLYLTNLIRRGNMPTVIIYPSEGKSIDQKRGVVKGITEAVCKNFAVSPEAVRILIREVKKEDYGRAGKLAIDS